MKIFNSIFNTFSENEFIVFFLGILQSLIVISLVNLSSIFLSSNPRDFQHRNSSSKLWKGNSHSENSNFGKILGRKSIYLLTSELFIVIEFWTSVDSVSSSIDHSNLIWTKIVSRQNSLFTYFFSIFILPSVSCNNLGFRIIFLIFYNWVNYLSENSVRVEVLAWVSSKQRVGATAGLTREAWRKWLRSTCTA